MRDFAAFDIEFDNYGSTNSPENRELCAPRSGSRLRKAGLVDERDVDAALRSRRPARSWPIGSCKGTCPKCRSPDQYGDNCEQVRSTTTARPN